MISVFPGAESSSGVFFLLSFLCSLMLAMTAAALRASTSSAVWLELGSERSRRKRRMMMRTLNSE